MAILDCFLAAAPLVERGSGDVGRVTKAYLRENGHGRAVVTEVI